MEPGRWLGWWWTGGGGRGGGGARWERGEDCGGWEEMGMGSMGMEADGERGLQSAADSKGPGMRRGGGKRRGAGERRRMGRRGKEG